MIENPQRYVLFLVILFGALALQGLQVITLPIQAVVQLVALRWYLKKS